MNNLPQVIGCWFGVMLLIGQSQLFNDRLIFLTDSSGILPLFSKKNRRFNLEEFRFDLDFIFTTRTEF